jgi:hypothetical protein
MSSKVAIIIVIVIVVLFLLWLPYSNTQETFDDIAGVDPLDPEHYDSNLANYYNNSSLDGIKPFLVDTMTCSPACCGTQWPVPFDNMSSGQLEQCIQTVNGGPSEDYVRTNMTCANGPNGVGCPCIDKRTYEFIAKRGNNDSDIIGYIDPTFIIKTNTDGDLSQNQDVYTPYEQLKAKKSYYTNERLLNDLGQLRRQYDLTHLRDVGSYGNGEVAYPPGWIQSLNPNNDLTDPRIMLDQYA